jgi:hypothetical protein
MAEPIDDHFTASLRAYPDLDTTSTVRDDDAPLRPGAALTVAQALDLFDAQLGSRHLDLAARPARRRDWLLHDRLLRARRQRRRRRCAMSCSASWRPRKNRSPADDTSLRPTRPARHPPNLPHRLAFAARPRSGIHVGTRPRAHRHVPMAGRRHHGLQLR